MGSVESRKGACMIPVIVNVFNRLTTTRKLCEQIAALNNAVPIIVDNNSTWEPLLDWYKDCPFDVIRLTENRGHHSPWASGVIDGLAANVGYYCVTDCDLDIEGVPHDLMEVLRRPLTSCLKGICGVRKSGVSLRINDLPETQTDVINWEQQFWKRPIANGAYYIAPVDTTLAMYPRSLPHSVATRVVGVRTVRSGPPYTVRHMPWYLDPTNLDEENANYFATANSSNSWRPDGEKLVSRFCK
jgi:hypothetical protein